MKNYRDPRIFFELEKFKKSNKEYQKKYLLFEPRFNLEYVREMWFTVKGNAFDYGYLLAHPSNLKIENLDNPLKTEFYLKFLDLCNEFNIFLQYHLNHGLVFVENIKQSTEDFNIEYIKKSLFFNDLSFDYSFRRSYKQSEVLEYKLSAFEVGLELGMNNSPLIGPKIDVFNNKLHEKFYEKFLNLCKNYNYRFGFSNNLGMLITDLEIKNY